eukprot:SAG11_NODE_10531_length_824_cov_1.197241_1_plen_195_part_10
MDVKYPRVWLLYNPQNGKHQAQSIRDQLQEQWPCLVDVHDWIDTKRVEYGDVVLVYLTEGVCGSPTLRRVESMVPRDGEVKVVWVAETDRRHGWDEMAARLDQKAIEEQEELSKSASNQLSSHTMVTQSSWRQCLKNELHTPPPGYFETSALQPQVVLRDVIPFYKDKFFRVVSLELIIRAIISAPKKRTWGVE